MLASKLNFICRYAQQMPAVRTAADHKLESSYGVHERARERASR